MPYRENILLLFCGLPGAGKSTLAQQIVHVRPDIAWFNADKVRAQYDDWDFSLEGRERQAKRMRMLGEACPKRIVILDLVAPTIALRDLIVPDKLLWMNTISRDASRFADTAKLFEEPSSAERLRPGFMELKTYIPNDSVKAFIDAYQPPYAVSNGRLAAEYQRQQRYAELVKQNNPEGLEALD